MSFRSRARTVIALMLVLEASELVPMTFFALLGLPLCLGTLQYFEEGARVAASDDTGYLVVNECDWALFGEGNDMRMRLRETVECESRRESNRGYSGQA